MLIDLRGLNHPEHLQKLRSHFEGLCTIYEDVEVLLDNNTETENLRKLEIYISSFRGKYTISSEGNLAVVKILAPFSLCG
jgi:hypothetical protein